MGVQLHRVRQGRCVRYPGERQEAHYPSRLRALLSLTKKFAILDSRTSPQRGHSPARAARSSGMLQTRTYHVDPGWYPALQMVVLLVAFRDEPSDHDLDFVA